MAWCSIGNEAANAAVWGELGMGVAHGFSVFVDGLATVLVYFTLTSFTFQDRRVRVGGEENRELHSTAMWPSCRIKKFT
jgi:uncharacterized membrane protein YhiD involved in acid resistance